MNKKTSSFLLRLAKLISLFLIMGTFLFMFVFCVFLPRQTVSDYDTLTEKPKFSFSSLLDGSYTSQLADYFTDTVHNRDRFKDLYARISNWFGKETIIRSEDGQTEIVIGNTSNPNDTSDASSTQSQGTLSNDNSGTDSSVPDNSTNTSSSETSSEEQSGQIDEELCNDILILGTRAMEIYFGDRTLKYIPTFAQTLNQFAEAFPNVNVYSMVIPKSCAYYLQASATYGDYADRTLNDLQAIEERLSSKVTSINVYDTLKAHAGEDIYFRTDHHWTALGAYYAAQKLASDLGLPFQDLSTYEKKVRSGYLGTMYKYTGYHTTLLNNPEDFVTYIPAATYRATFYNHSFQNPTEKDSLFLNISDDAKSSWYLTFIGGDSYAVKLESNACTNGRKLLIVKDSYGNALAPYLLYSFQEIYIVDARYFECNLKTFIPEQGITDVLFAECALSAVGSNYIGYLQGLFD